jgi:hypothetical protein
MYHGTKEGSDQDKNRLWALQQAGVERNLYLQCNRILD